MFDAECMPLSIAGAIFVGAGSGGNITRKLNIISTLSRGVKVSEHQCMAGREKKYPLFRQRMYGWEGSEMSEESGNFKIRICIHTVHR